MTRHDFGGYQVRVRPNKKGTRPRTKQRPRHQDALPAFVTGVHRGRWHVLVGDTPVRAMRARELGRTSIVVGDWVEVVGDTSGTAGSLARIVRVQERRNVLRRTADDTDPYERVVVANADQLLIVTALADPPPREGLIDRALVAAVDAGISPVLVLTKADLASPAKLLRHYAAVNLPAIVLSCDRETGKFSSLKALTDLLQNKTSVLLGHSGVGKSTLVNALVPQANRATGAVNDVTGRGRHTSTSAIALPLPAGGWVIDTPGIRSFGLAHVQSETIANYFIDLSAGLKDCPRGCNHQESECGIFRLVESGQAGAAGLARLESLQRLLAAQADRTHYD